MARTWDELIDDGQTLAKVFVQLKNITNRDSLVLVTEAQNILQKKTKAVRRQFTLLTSSLSADGSVDKDREVGELVRADYYPTGSASACKAFVIGYAQWMDMVRSGSQTNGIYPVNSNFNKIALTSYMNKLFVLPPTSLNGQFIITYLPKLTKFSIKGADDSTGPWAAFGPSDAAFTAAVESLGPEPEFDYAEEGIAMYVAAQYLKKYPAAFMTYEHQYNEWMAGFNSCWEDVIQSDVPYNINQGPHGYTGPTNY